MAGPTSLGGGLTRWVQSSVANWPTGFHTNLLTFNDNAGGSYTYPWQWNVIGNANGPTVADTTNVPIIIPVSAMVNPNTLSQPGIRVLAHEAPFKTGNTIGQTEQQLMDLHGLNLANLGGVAIPPNQP